MPAGVDRHIHVFTREAAAAAEASSRSVYSLTCTWHKMHYTVHTLVALISCMPPGDMLLNPHAWRAAMWLKHAATRAVTWDKQKISHEFCCLACSCAAAPM